VTLVGTVVVPLVGGAGVGVVAPSLAVAPGVVPCAGGIVLPAVVPTVVVDTSTQAMIPTVT
jgi:hypothetical protein